MWDNNGRIYSAERSLHSPCSICINHQGLIPFCQHHFKFFSGNKLGFFGFRSLGHKERCHSDGSKRRRNESISKANWSCRKQQGNLHDSSGHVCIGLRFNLLLELNWWYPIAGVARLGLRANKDHKRHRRIPKIESRDARSNKSFSSNHASSWNWTNFDVSTRSIIARVSGRFAGESRNSGVSCTSGRCRRTTMIDAYGIPLEMVLTRKCMSIVLQLGAIFVGNTGAIVLIHYRWMGCSTWDKWEATCP